MTMTVKTNNVPRELLTVNDLTIRQCLTNNIPDRSDDPVFWYGGDLFKVNEFTRLPRGLNGQGDKWEYGMATTVWSGYVIRLVTVDGDTMVIVGRYWE